MNKIVTRSGMLALAAALFGALAAGCGGDDQGKDPILGIGDIVSLAPTVTAVAPADDATGVPINNTIITAAFSEPMAAIAGGASFTVTCAAPCANPTGTVALDGTSRIATFTLAVATTLEPLTLYTATVTNATSLATGLALANPFVWQFTTGLTPDTTRPRVTVTAPATTVPGPTPAVPTNTAITAVFTEDMAPATILAASFTVVCGVPCTSPAGNVTYAVGSRTATFTPATALADGTTYTATVTTAATDLAGNALAGNQAALPAASDYVWTFTTAAAIPPADISVQATNPDADETGVCPNATINATFDVPSGLRMDDLTINAATFTVTGPGLAVVTAASVVLDGPTGTIATFTPQSALIAGDTYTVTIIGGSNGVKDLALPPNEMSNDFSWEFTAGPATGNCLASPDMGAATPFAIAATAGLANAPTAPVTTINGDVVLDPNQTCNLVTVPNDGSFGLCGGAPPTLNGQVITNTFPDTTTSTAIRNDLNAAFLAITPLAGPPAVGTLGGGATIAAPTTLGGPAGSPLVLGVNHFTPGVYTSPAAINISGDFTLDAQGNPNAVFVFQAGSALNIAAGAIAPGPHTRIILAGGARASNVWWQVGSSATIGTFAEFNGNVLAAFDITLENGASSCGRMMSGAWVGGSGALIFEANLVSIPGNGCPP